jgi:general secretion pathway protein B
VPEHAPARAPEPAPAAAQPAPAAVQPALSRPAPEAAQPAPSRPAAEARAVAPAPAPKPAAAPAPAPEDGLPFLQQLPEAQQRDIPRVTFGGYMYSSNPSDRLLIVDKALRHEGEEVAPGLVLEKLLPKAAVMNFRGIRYRVAY